MLKNILNLEGAQKLTKNEQKSITGGLSKACVEALAANGCVSGSVCPTGYSQVGPWSICGAVGICCPV